MRAVKNVLESDPTPELVTDYDGNKYGVVRIGNQLWIASDIRTRHYMNGDNIPNVVADIEWSGLTTPAYCTYNNI